MPSLESAGPCCRFCSYSLEGLDPAGVCPECGEAVSKSFARHVPGSPWQRRPGVRTFVHSAAWVLSDEWWGCKLRAEPARDNGLMIVSLLIVALVPAAIAPVFGVASEAVAGPLSMQMADSLLVGAASSLGAAGVALACIATGEILIGAALYFFGDVRPRATARALMAHWACGMSALAAALGALVLLALLASCWWRNAGAVVLMAGYAALVVMGAGVSVSCAVVRGAQERRWM